MTDEIRKTASHKERAITLAAMLHINAKRKLKGLMNVGVEELTSPDYLAELDIERNIIFQEILAEGVAV